MSRKCSEEISAIKLLETAYYRENIGRNRMLVFVMSLTIILLFGVYSLVFGKLSTDTIRQTKELGMITSAYLENGTEEIEKKIEKLAFVNRIGHYKKSGLLAFDGKNIGECVFVDQATFEEIMLPAYGKVYGVYPQKSNEIMLPVSSLKEIGVKEPFLGMKLMLNFNWYGMNEQDSGEQEFILTGYYEDYYNGVMGMPVAFISQDRLNKSHIASYPQRILIGIETDYLSGSQVETMLYHAITLSRDDQLFVSMDSPRYKAIENMIGGYELAFVFSVFILLSMFLLVYNILFISLEHDKNQFVMLNIIGVTHRQLHQIIGRIGIRIFIKTVLIGGLTGSLAVLVGMPILVKKMYLANMGDMDKVQTFHPVLLMVAVLFTALTLSCALWLSVNKLNKYSPIEVLSGGGKSNGNLGMIKKKCGKWKGSVAMRMAWRNVTRSKGRFFFTLLSMILGCQIALTGAMIIRGVDNRNELEQKPDVVIGLTKEALVEYPYHEAEAVTEEVIYDYSLISEDFLQRLDLLTGESKVERIYGCFAGIDDVKESDYFQLSRGERFKCRQETALEPLYKNNYALWDGTRAGYSGIGIIQVIEEQQLEQLESYISEKPSAADMELLKNGDGALIVHENALSENERQQAEETVGTVLYLYPISVLYEEEDTYIEKGQLTNCGYLDSSDKDFPAITKNWMGQDVLYFFVSRDTFEKLDAFPEQTFQINLTTQDDQMDFSDIPFRQLVKEENRKFRSETGQNTDLLFLSCKSDIIAERNDYLNAGRIIAGVISASLLLIGIMNYFNTIITDILVRKQEFYILSYVGMTRKQMVNMLIGESMIYWIIVNIFCATLGNLTLYFMANVMKGKVDYFVFQYPYIPYLIISGFTLFVCIFLPVITYFPSVLQAFQYKDGNAAAKH